MVMKMTRWMTDWENDSTINETEYIRHYEYMKMVQDVLKSYRKKDLF